MNETCSPAINQGWSDIVLSADFSRRSTCGQYLHYYVSLLFSSPFSTRHVKHPPKCLLKLTKNCPAGMGYSSNDIVSKIPEVNRIISIRSMHLAPDDVL